MLYKPLDKKEIKSIVDLMLRSLDKRLKDKQLKLEVTDKAKDYIVENGYDPVYGARPLKRFIQHNVETLIARHIIEGEYLPNAVIKVDANENGLYVS